MSYFKTKMHQIRLRLGSAPDPAGGEREGKGGERRGRGREWKGGKGRGEKGECAQFCIQIWGDRSSC